jgi:ankyrin repeat protein
MVEISFAVVTRPYRDWKFYEDTSSAKSSAPSSIMKMELHVAASEGDLEAVLRVLGKGFDINTRDGNGDTALHRAAEQGQSAIIWVLLANGANFHLGSKALRTRGWTAFHMASSEGHISVVTLLLRVGLDVTDNGGYLETPLHLVPEAGPTNIVFEFLQNGDYIMTNDRHLPTALHLIAEQEDSDVVETLLKHGAQISAATEHEQTALYIAARHGHSDVVEVLLKHGAQISTPTQYERTALHVAARYGHSDVVEVLLKHGGQISVATQEGKTTLHFAAVRRNTAAARLLLENGTDINAECNPDKENALHTASELQNIAMARLLLEYGADVNGPNGNKCRTPLTIAENRRYHNVGRVAAWARGSRSLRHILNHKSKVYSLTIQPREHLRLGSSLNTDYSQLLFANGNGGLQMEQSSEPKSTSLGCILEPYRASIWKLVKSRFRNISKAQL